MQLGGARADHQDVVPQPQLLGQQRLQRLEVSIPGNKKELIRTCLEEKVRLARPTARLTAARMIGQQLREDRTHHSTGSDAIEMF